HGRQGQPLPHPHETPQRPRRTRRPPHERRRRPRPQARPRPTPAAAHPPGRPQPPRRLPAPLSPPPPRRRRTPPPHLAPTPDRLGHPQTPLWRTTDWLYLRLHEGPAQPWPNYDDTTLRTWADTLGSTSDAYVYFNNDPGGAAVRNALRFIELTTPP